MSRFLNKGVSFLVNECINWNWEEGKNFSLIKIGGKIRVMTQLRRRGKRGVGSEHHLLSYTADNIPSSDSTKGSQHFHKAQNISLRRGRRTWSDKTKFTRMECFNGCKTMTTL